MIFQHTIRFTTFRIHHVDKTLISALSDLLYSRLFGLDVLTVVFQLRPAYDDLAYSQEVCNLSLVIISFR